MLLVLENFSLSSQSQILQQEDLIPHCIQEIWQKELCKGQSNVLRIVEPPPIGTQQRLSAHDIQSTSHEIKDAWKYIWIRDSTTSNGLYAGYADLMQSTDCSFVCILLVYWLIHTPIDGISLKWSVRIHWITCLLILSELAAHNLLC